MDLGMNIYSIRKALRLPDKAAAFFAVTILASCAGDGESIYNIETVNGPNGTISPSNIVVEEGQRIDFTLNPDLDYTVDKVTGCGGVLSGNTYTTGSIHDDCTIEATFRARFISFGFSGPVKSIVLSTDGSGGFYVGGGFGIYNSNAGGLLRFNSDASLDESFRSDVGAVSTMVSAGDGSGDIYLDANGLSRINSDGSLDSDFDTGTKFHHGGQVNAIADANDGTGDIYVGGSFEYNGVRDQHLVRLNSDGSRDGFFDIGSGVNGHLDTINAIVATNDGSGDVYVGGRFWSFNGVPVFSILRLNSDGSLDSGFDVGTSVWRSNPLWQGGGDLGWVYAIEAATDGSGDIYVGGDFTHYDGSPSSGIVRLNSDGSLDTAFDVGRGFVSTVLSIAMAEDGTGDVYVGGAFNRYNKKSANKFLRLNSNASIDENFNTGWGFDGNVETIVPALDGTGAVYIGGAFTRYNRSLGNSLVRVLNDGSVNSVFGHGSGFDKPVFAIASANDDSEGIYVAGEFSTFDSRKRNNIVKMNNDGTLDSGFHSGSGTNGPINAIVAANDGTGDVYVGGSFTKYDGIPIRDIARLNGDGSLDQDFDPGSGFNREIRVMALAGNGSGNIYVGGEFVSFDGISRYRIARLNRDGTLDRRFRTDPGFNGPVFAIAVADDGTDDIYVGGSFTGYDGIPTRNIARLNSDGSLDRAFDVGSGFSRDAAYFNKPTIVTGLAFENGESDIYAVGSFTHYDGEFSNKIARINPDGTLDPGFIPRNGFNNMIDSVALAVDGSGDIYVSGQFSRAAGISAHGVARLNDDGSPDTGFQVTGRVDTQANIEPAVDGSGDIFTVERFDFRGGQYLVKRLNSSGLLN